MRTSGKRRWARLLKLGMVVYIILAFFNFNTATKADLVADVSDAAPIFINADSGPIAVLNLTLYNNSSGGGNFLNSIMNITVEKLGPTPFDPTVDLAPPSNTTNSGLTLYYETNSIDGFQPTDTLIDVWPADWIGSDPTWWTDLSNLDSVTSSLPSSDPGSSNYYIVIRTNSTIQHGVSFRVGIYANGILSDYGSDPLTDIWSSNITTDLSHPTSSADIINPYWQNTSPIEITVSASDDFSGVKNVTLWYRYSADNSSWDSWTIYPVEPNTPWSWSFNWPSGQGYYQFYSTANDSLGNLESQPASADSIAHYDAEAPPPPPTIPLIGLSSLVLLILSILLHFYITFRWRKLIREGPIAGRSEEIQAHIREAEARITEALKEEP